MSPHGDTFLIDKKAPGNDAKYNHKEYIPMKNIFIINLSLS
jgi:hypothetical protein